MWFLIGCGFLMFCSFAFIMLHVNVRSLRKILGYPFFIDILLHGTVFYLVLTTGTISGLLEAEIAAIIGSISLRIMRKLIGYERLGKRGWIRYRGWTT